MDKLPEFCRKFMLCVFGASIRAIEQKSTIIQTFHVTRDTMMLLFHVMTLEFWKFFIHL